MKEFRVNNIMRDQQFHGRNDEEVIYQVVFGNVTVNQFPHNIDSDENNHTRYEPILPHVARLRSLTYQTEIYVAVEVKKLKKGVHKGDGVRPIISETTLY